MSHAGHGPCTSLHTVVLSSKDTGSDTDTDELGRIVGTALILSELFRRNCRNVREGMLDITILRDICGSNSSIKPFENNKNHSMINPLNIDHT